MPKQLLDKLSIYVPKTRLEERPVERLLELAEKKDRSVNYLVVEAILQYLKQDEKKMQFELGWAGGPRPSVLYGC